MINGTAAGHTFVDGVCAGCGRKLVDLQGLDPVKDLNKPDIAHSGGATDYEIRQINALVEKMHQQVENSLGWRRPQPAEVNAGE